MATAATFASMKSLSLMIVVKIKENITINKLDKDKVAMEAIVQEVQKEAQEAIINNIVNIDQVKHLFQDHPFNKNSSFYKFI